MESCSSSINKIDSIKHYENKLPLLENKIEVLKNEENQNISQPRKSEMLLTTILTNSDSHKNELINSPSTSTIFSEREIKEIEKAYQVTDNSHFEKIRRIDPSRFLHSLPDGAYPQLPKLKKYTTIYTSKTLFPINDNDKNNCLENSKLKNEIENTTCSQENNIDINSNKYETKNSENPDNNIITHNQLNNDINLKNNNEIKIISTENKINIDKTYKNLMPKFTDIVKVKKINFPMIMDVLNGKRTSTLYERHVSIIEKLIIIIKESMVF